MTRPTRRRTAGTAAVTAALTASLALAAAATVAAPAIAAPPDGPFLSEIHYDNAGGDSGEAVEVTAPGGTDLTGWSVALYNGNGGAVYDTLELTGTAGGAGDDWGVVSVDAPGMQNGAPDGLALVDPDGGVAELLSYEGTLTATAGPADGTTSTDIGVAEGAGTPVGESLQLVGDDDARTWTGPVAASFGALNDGLLGGTGAPPPPDPVCGDPATAVSAVQGAGAASPLEGEQVQVEAVVTSVAPGLDGFWVQEEAADTDGDPATSEGVFVFRADTVPDVGDRVRVAGTAGEFASSGSSQTQLSGSPRVAVCASGEELPEPAGVTFPLAEPDDLEPVEGMLVALPQSLVISEYFQFDRFGEVVLGLPLPGEDRLYSPTAVVDPGPAAQARLAENQRRVITVDDRSSTQNPETLVHPGNGESFDLDNRFRGGDTVTGLEGVLDNTFGRYRVQPTTYGDYVATNPRPADRPDVGGDVQVASLNVLNYFLTLDDGTPRCGPAGDLDCRGADDTGELERQRAKTLAALRELDADVVGLMEMENSTGVEPAADLASGLNDVLGDGTYDSVDTGTVGTDAIRVGMLYKPAAVTPVGEPAVLDSGVDARFDDTRNRPALAQTFDSGGARFTVTVNHLKSKGSGCGPGDDTDDGSGNCDGTRTRAAEALVDWLDTDPTGSGDPDQLVIGDLNSYDHERPISTFTGAGWTDLVGRTGGELAYGYVFDGQVGYLDHALANPALAPAVTGAREWHVNADEPDVLDYDTTFKPDPVDALYAPDPYRSSDHDAVLVGIDLEDPAACYAGGHQRVADYTPGRRGNGSRVPRPRADPRAALGPTPGAHRGAVSLGLGGSIALSFASPVVDGAGADLRVVDARDGARGRGDSALVQASADGSRWVDLGEVTRTGTVDLAAGGLDRAVAVRVVDRTPRRGAPRSVDGYDLDAVTVLSGCRCPTPW